MNHWRSKLGSLDDLIYKSDWFDLDGMNAIRVGV